MHIAARIYSKATNKKRVTKLFRFGKTIFSYLMILLDGLNTAYLLCGVPGYYRR